MKAENTPKGPICARVSVTTMAAQSTLLCYKCDVFRSNTRCILIWIYNISILMYYNLLTQDRNFNCCCSLLQSDVTSHRRHLRQLSRSSLTGMTSDWRRLQQQLKARIKCPIYYLELEGYNSQTVIEQDRWVHIVLYHMRIYAGLSPTTVDHREELMWASSCSLSDVK